MADNISPVQSSNFIIFHMGSEEFGLELSYVREVIRTEEIVDVPKAPDYVKGVINLRGQIISIVDVARYLSLSLTDDFEKNRFIICQAKDTVLGFKVDEVFEVMNIAGDNIEPTSKVLVKEAHAQFIKGIAKTEQRLIMILNIEKIIENIF